jgi:hypothetical protein
MQVAMKGVGVATTTIPTMKAKVVATIVLEVKVKVATPIVKAEEVAAITRAIKVEVAEKKTKGEATKVENEC